MTKQLAVIGKNNLNNSLLASYIEQNTSYPCYIADLVAHTCVLQKVPLKFADLLLIDCSRLNDEQIQSLLDKCANTIAHESHIALFNTGESDDTEHFAQHILVKGVFSEDVSHEQLILGIKSIFNGELWLSRKLLSNLLIKNRKNPQPQNEDFGLTRRETEIIKLIAVGSRNNDIADILCLSPHTVKTHIYHIYKKLNVDNRMQAANWANQHWSLNA